MVLNHLLTFRTTLQLGCFQINMGVNEVVVPLSFMFCHPGSLPHSIEQIKDLNSLTVKQTSLQILKSTQSSFAHYPTPSPYHKIQ